MRVFDALPLSMPGLLATRWTSTELYSGMKEVYAVARVEHGQGE